MEFFKNASAKEIEIIPVGDIHIGQKAHKGRHFLKTLQYIQAKKNRYWFYMGDGPENAMPGEGTMLYDQSMMPNEQMQALIGHFKKISGKCLGGIIGNHEMRSIRTALMDPVSQMFSALGILERYFSVGGMFRAIVGSQQYYLTFYHGYKGSKNNPFIEFPDRQETHPESDIICLGHTHNLCYRPNVCLTIDDKNQEHALMKYWVRTGTYLGYADYARFAGYKPGRVGSPIIRLYGKEKKIEIDDQTLSAA